MPRRPRAALLLLAAPWLAACDAPTEPTSLEVTLTAAPEPAPAAASQGVFYTIEATDTRPEEQREYPWKTSFVVTLEETGGLAVSITSVNLRVQQAAGGIVIAPSGGAVERYQFNSSASGNSLPARGRASVGFEVWYDLPNKGQEALVTVSFTFRDDDGNNFQDTVEIRVA